MRHRRHRQKKKQEEIALFRKPEVEGITSDIPVKRTPTKKHKSDSWGNTVQVANVIAWYVNPAIYVLYSVVYLTVGMTVG